MGIGFLVSGLIFSMVLNQYVPKHRFEEEARKNGMIYEGECRVWKASGTEKVEESKEIKD